MPLDSIKRKIVLGIALALLLYTYMAFYWVINKSPYRLVDCYTGKYTFELMAKDCKTAFSEISK